MVSFPISGPFGSAHGVVAVTASTRCCAASTPSTGPYYGGRRDGAPRVDAIDAERRADARNARRFGHGTVKMVRQAQSREKLLQKKLEEGLTEKPRRDAEWDFSFPDPGELPTPVLMIQDVSFAYPNSEPLYHNLDLGIDLQSRIALVGPNGAGKTTFVKLMTGELQPTSVTQRRMQFNFST